MLGVGEIRSRAGNYYKLTANATHFPNTQHPTPNTSSAMPLGTLGKYERLDVLGHGVSGIVYLAKDTLLNRQVALKEVDVQAGDMRRFLEEARVMDRLRHPNIARVNNIDRIDGKIVIDMEYVRGSNLQDLLRQEGALDLDRALDIAAQVLDALDYAHKMQTAHRDIKPANIMVDRDGQVKLVDFGLAEILATNAYAGGAGTYAYMAPEDFAEQDRSDHQSDIWAVGVTLFEILTLQRPFNVSRVKDPFAWKRVLENEAPAPITDYLPDAPPQLQAILDIALEKDKRRRYQTAGEFRDDVLRLRSLPRTAQTTAPAQMPPDATAAAPIFPSHSTTTKFAPQFELPERAVVTQKNAPPVPALPVSSPTLMMPSHAAPGTVVAEASPASVAKGREKGAGRSLFRRKEAAAQVFVDPKWADFGEVRKGDLRSVKVRIRVEGAGESVAGGVTRKPEWLTAHPMNFDAARQTLTLTAHSARAWETGDFTDSLSLSTAAGEVEIPVRLTVLKPRPSFVSVALWYVPLYAAALMPVLLVAIFGGGHPSAALTAPAAVSSALLAVMLLLISNAADLGMGERAACAVLLSVMCLALGMSHPTRSASAMQHSFMTGGLIGLTLALQLLYLRKWKLWGFAMLGLSAFISATLWRVLTGS